MGAVLRGSQPLMNKTVSEAIWFTLTTLTFSLALAYALTPLFQIQKEFEISPGTEGSVYVKQTEIPEEPLFTGAQIISSIYKLDFDETTVNVDGNLFERQTDLKTKQSIILPYAEYKQTIQYSGSGTRINYTMQ
ncbi:hypothetical protein [Solibacillus sp. FSL W7-1324]|uniref:hypothetical protein n=1 Tax=Solibacillus sp. FSL W7-1324 TaxID=2921701 RepID=UPI0030F9965B